MSNQFQILIISMTNYRLINEQNQAAGKQRSLMDLARNMRQLLVEDKQKEEGMQLSGPSSHGGYKKPVFTVNDMESTFLTMNKSLLYVGDNSTFQKRITWILAIQWISFSFMVNSMAYFFRSPNFSCRVPYTDTFVSCSQTAACRLNPNDFRVIGVGHSQVSIVEQFQLYCGSAGDIYFVEGLFFLGGCLSYVISYISERIGRRPVIISVLVLSIISMMLCAWAPNFDFFTVSYFFAGCFLFGYETTVYIYISEISAVRFKTISINMLTMVWAGTPIFLALLGLIDTWRLSFTLFAVIWAATLPFAYFCFLESPRFLLTKKCYSQVRSIFQKISKTNRRPPYQFKLMEEMQVQNDTFLLLKDDDWETSHRKSEWAQVRQYNYLDLFRYSSVKKATFLLMYLWMFRFFMYFAMNLALESVLQSGFMLTLAISTSSFAEVIGTFGIPILTFLFSRKYTSIQIIRKCVLALAFLCAALWFIKVDNNCKIFEQNSFCVEVLTMIALVNCIKFTNSIFFSALITYSSEVYPTVVRSLGYGFTLTFGRMSTFIVPFYINYMRSQYQNRNALCFLAPFGVLGFFLCSLTGNASDVMKQTIPEEDEQIRLNREVRDVEMNVIQKILPQKDSGVTNEVSKVAADVVNDKALQKF